MYCLTSLISSNTTHVIEEGAREDEEGRDAEYDEDQLPAVNEADDEAGYEGRDVLEEVTEFVPDSILELAHVANIRMQRPIAVNSN